MMYVVYHKDTTRYLRNHPKVQTIWNAFASERAAKAALTREVNRGAVLRSDFLITDAETFQSIEKQVVKKNLMTGEEFSQSANTPIGCDPSSETYWSM